MLEDDVIEEASEPSPWVSTLVVVPKVSGGLRVCCDYRELNKVIIRQGMFCLKLKMFCMHCVGQSILQRSTLGADFFN